MRLEDQVASLELCKRLKELGVKQEDSLFAWIKCNKKDEVHWTKTPVVWPDQEYFISTNLKEWSWAEWQCAAFTVAELGEILPGHVGMDWFLRFWKSDFSGPASFSINYKDPKTEGNPEIGWMMETIIEKKEADARAKMLIHLIEKGIVRP